MKTIIKNNLIRSVIINLIILIGVMLFTQLSYETNDDYAIASRIVDGYPYVGFMNYFLCKVLIAVQGAAGNVNVYAVFLIGASYVAFVCLLHTLLEASDNILLRIISAAAIAIFAFDHYSTIQFTKTAALLMTAGMIMLEDSITRKRSVASYIASVILLYLGACVRVDALPGAIGFACVFSAMRILFDRKKSSVSDSGSRADLWKRALLYVLTAVLLIGAFGIDRLSSDINVSTEELRTAEDYSLLRSNIVDFPTYEYYEENKNEYDKIGISENDIYLIDHWVFDYEGAASLENLRKIDSIERPQGNPTEKLRTAARKFVKDSIKAVRKRSFTGIHLILMITIAIWMAICLRPKHWLYIIGTAIVASGLYAALYYLQRPTYRGLYIADIGAVFWLLYYMMRVSSEKPEDTRPRLMHFTGIAVCLAALLMLVPVQSGCADRYDSACSKIMSEKLAEYFDDNSDKVFIWSTTEKKQSRDYASPMTAPGKTENNVFGTGGWGAMSPYMLNKYSELDMYSPVADLVNNDHAYLVADKHIDRFEEYYNKWYGRKDKYIYLELVDHVDGRDIWRVSDEPRA